MLVLGIDVGIKTLAYCLVESANPWQIVRWDTVCILPENENVRKVNVESLTEFMLDKLLGLFNDSFAADVVLIENQPMLKNGLMKTMSVVIYTYFNMLKLQFGEVKSVRFVNASNKLKCLKYGGTNMPVAKSYTDRKKAAIALVQLYLADNCPEKVDWFKTHKKKDDLADALLYCIYFSEKQSAAVPLTVCTQ